MRKKQTDGMTEQRSEFDSTLKEINYRIKDCERLILITETKIQTLKEIRQILEYERDGETGQVDI